MKIVVCDGKKHNLRLRLPTGLFLNRFTAGLISEALKQQRIVMSKEQAIMFIKVLRDYKRKHPRWKLVEVEGAKGEKVEITL